VDVSDQQTDLDVLRFAHFWRWPPYRALPAKDGPPEIALVRP